MDDKYDLPWIRARLFALEGEGTCLSVPGIDMLEKYGDEEQVFRVVPEFEARELWELNNKRKMLDDICNYVPEYTKVYDKMGRIIEENARLKERIKKLENKE